MDEIPERLVPRPPATCQSKSLRQSHYSSNEVGEVVTGLNTGLRAASSASGPVLVDLVCVHPVQPHLLYHAFSF